MDSQASSILEVFRKFSQNSASLTRPQAEIKGPRRHLTAPGAIAGALLEAGIWSEAGRMGPARWGHRASLLANGKVLITGSYSKIAKIYDPASSEFRLVGAMVYQHGVYSTATRLNDGRVLIVGGSDAPGSAEIFDPESERFAEACSLRFPRSAHSATLMADGRVLVAGGEVGPKNAGLAYAEVFDPMTGWFKTVGPMVERRTGHGAVLLLDGLVLLVGGGLVRPDGKPGDLRTAELFDPVSGGFEATGRMNSSHGNLWCTEPQILDDGRVLIVGGASARCGELYDPLSGRFSQTGRLLTSRSAATVAKLPDGRVLVCGGYSISENGVAATLDTSEFYDPVSDDFSPAASMREGRQQHTMTILPGGRVLVTGGWDSAAARDLASAEVLWCAPAEVGELAN